MMLQVMRRLGAVAILAVGAVHLQQYIVEDFQTIPTIATLYLLNVIGSGIVGVGFLAPLERVLRARVADAAVALLAVAAVFIAVGSLVAVFISESGTLFGFMEIGYRTPVVLAIIAEGATILLLAPVLAVSSAGALARRDRPAIRREWPPRSLTDRAVTR